MVQRARLADALLGDIYGEQRMIARRPSARRILIYTLAIRNISAPAWHGTDRRAGCMCICIPPIWRANVPTAPGLDHGVARRCAGRAWAMRWKTGIGGEPDLPGFLRRHARGAAGFSFFNAYREKYPAVAGAFAPRPRRAADASGPYNESYFEHVYLAHYLGLTLVEGDDLVVRDGQVFLKDL